MKCEDERGNVLSRDDYVKTYKYSYKWKDAWIMKGKGLEGSSGTPAAWRSHDILRIHEIRQIFSRDERNQNGGLSSRELREMRVSARIESRESNRRRHSLSEHSIHAEICS